MSAASESHLHSGNGQLLDAVTATSNEFHFTCDSIASESFSEAIS
jgi:hypothetical protein